MSIKNGSNFWKKNSKSISRITHKNLRNSRTFIKLRKLNNLLKFLKIIRKPDRRSSKIYENREKPMKIVKNLWKSYKSYHHQKFMKIYKNREKAVKIVKNLKIVFSKKAVVKFPDICGPNSVFQPIFCYFVYFAKKLSNWD